MLDQEESARLSALIWWHRASGLPMEAWVDLLAQEQADPEAIWDAIKNIETEAIERITILCHIVALRRDWEERFQEVIAADGIAPQSLAWSMPVVPPRLDRDVEPRLTGDPIQDEVILQKWADDEEPMCRSSKFQKAGSPENLKLAGSFVISSPLSVLPTGLEARLLWSENLEEAKQLLRLEGPLRVVGDAELNDQKQLSHLGLGIRIGGNFDLSGCERLEALPPDLEVGGLLDLSGCDSLMEIPMTVRAAHIIPPLGLGVGDFVIQPTDEAYDPIQTPTYDTRRLWLPIRELPVLILDCPSGFHWHAGAACGCCLDLYQGAALPLQVAKDELRVFQEDFLNLKALRNILRSQRLSPWSSIKDAIFIEHTANTLGSLKVLLRLQPDLDDILDFDSQVETVTGWLVWHRDH